MTDLQRHLKSIRKVFANSLEQALAGQSVDLRLLRDQLRSVLPFAYGIGSGCVISNGETSQPIQVIIYDVPLSNGIYTADSRQFHIEHVLLIVDFAAEHTEITFQSALERLASVKQLHTLRKRLPRMVEVKEVAQERPKIPKDRLPFAMMYFAHFVDNPIANERLFQRLLAWISIYPVEYRPDEIDVVEQQIQYRNPLLDNETVTADDIGINLLPNLRKPQNCYVCKSPYFRRHFFYDKLCVRCGDANYRHRIAKADLVGYVALVTGARVKIGYAAALNLLRAGTEVIATSRFPRDTAQRFASEPDFEEWRNRLHVYRLDLRQIQQLEPFINRLYERFSHLDVIVNNAAQTIKRPAAFYRHLIPLETMPQIELPAHIKNIVDESEPFAIQPNSDYLLSYAETNNGDFPTSEFDAHGQQIDNRAFNSWVMPLNEVSIPEMLEVHLVNAVAPGILVGQLKQLMQQSPHPKKFIVNVSSAEGRFSQTKNGFHPHSNMAKAALNMLTHSIASEYAGSGILVNSVDPGWVSDQVPRRDNFSRNLAEERLPIDLTDAAARICAPIFEALNNDNYIYGKLLKDYKAVEW